MCAGLRFAIALGVSTLVGSVLAALGVPSVVMVVMMSLLVMPIPVVYAHFATDAKHNHALVPGAFQAPRA